jgi:hypothetical protein
MIIHSEPTELIRDTREHWGAHTIRERRMSIRGFEQGIHEGFGRSIVRVAL